MIFIFEKLLSIMEFELSMTSSYLGFIELEMINKFLNNEVGKYSVGYELDDIINNFLENLNDIEYEYLCDKYNITIDDVNETFFEEWCHDESQTFEWMLRETTEKERKDYVLGNCRIWRDIMERNDNFKKYT